MAEYGIQTFTKEGILQLDSRWAVLGGYDHDTVSLKYYDQSKNGIYYNSFVMRDYGMGFISCEGKTIAIRSAKKTGSFNNIEVEIMTDSPHTECQIHKYAPTNSEFEKRFFEKNEDYGIWTDKKITGHRMLNNIMCISDYNVGDVFHTAFNKPAVSLSGQLFHIEKDLKYGGNIIAPAGVRIDGGSVEIRQIENDKMHMSSDLFNVYMNEFNKKYPIWIIDTEPSPKL